MLSRGAQGQVFPGGAAFVSVRSKGELWECTAVGGELEPRGAKVSADTLYDVASLTKPVFATVCFRLAERRELDLATRTDTVLADAKGTAAGAATLAELLSHRGGVAAWGGLYLDAPGGIGSTMARRWMVSESLRRPSDAPPGTAVYSDLGYIIAAEVVCKLTRRDLPTLVDREVVTPLGLPSADFCFANQIALLGDEQIRARVAPTERDEWRGRVVRGQVHDENCFAMGGVSGHAGLFATVRAFGMFGRAVLDATTGASEAWLPRARMQSALSPQGLGTARMGWDGKSTLGSSAGTLMSTESFGHLGFTGTSIWCDPRRDVVIVLFTNRVCPGRANERIKGFRPVFHDALVRILDA